VAVCHAAQVRPRHSSADPAEVPAGVHAAAR
jgi:hypothetical protein